jgi:hypothetical protein
MEYTVANNFYLFNAYSNNLYTLREYMDFIDLHFNFAFKNLGYKIVKYEYPDIEDNSWGNIIPIESISYINDVYKLKGDEYLQWGYHLNIFSDKHTGGRILFNDHVYYDLDALLYDGTEDDISGKLMDIADYMEDRKLKSLFKVLGLTMLEYDSAISEYEEKCSDVEYLSEMVDEPNFILSRWKLYIRKEMMKWEE